MQSARSLRAWQTSMDLLVEVYGLSRSFPRDELFVMTSQLRRAVLSVPSNIAEGNTRETVADRRHFFTAARGSLAEVDTQLEAAVRLGYAPQARIASILELVEHSNALLINLSRNARPNRIHVDR